jgi:hypothetical protein
MILFFILQVILLFFMIFHDWIPFSPLNNVEALKRTDANFYRLLDSVINGATVLIPLLITLAYYPKSFFPLPAIIIITLFYFFLTIGTILSWWTPYFFTSSEKHKQRFKKFKETHHFLPERGDNVIPNTLHVILHVQVWACLAFSIYFLFKQ